MWHTSPNSPHVGPCGGLHKQPGQQQMCACARTTSCPQASCERHTHHKRPRARCMPASQLASPPVHHARARSCLLNPRHQWRMRWACANAAAISDCGPVLPAIPALLPHHYLLTYYLQPPAMCCSRSFTARATALATPSGPRVRARCARSHAEVAVVHRGKLELRHHLPPGKPAPMQLLLRGRGALHRCKLQVHKALQPCSHTHFRRRRCLRCGVSSIACLPSNPLPL